MKHPASAFSLRTILLGTAFGLFVPGAALAQTTVDVATTSQMSLGADEALTVTSTGSIVTTGRAVTIANTGSGTATVVNQGRIESTGTNATSSGIGPNAAVNLHLTNEAGAFIGGGSGVYLRTGEVINRGTIEARITGSSAADAIRAETNSIIRLEAGSVTSASTATTGTSYAVNVHGGGNSVYLDTDATVNGRIRAAAGTAAGNRMYLTGSGTKTLTDVLGFDGYNVLSGDWTVTSAFTAALEGTNIASGAILRWGNGGTGGAITGQITNHGTLVINRSNEVDLAAPITGTGAVILDSPVAGVLTIGANSTYSGNTIVRSGTLRGGMTNALSSNSQVTVETAGILDIVAGFDQQVGGLSGTGETRINGATLTLGGSGVNTSYTGALSGSGSLIKMGTGVLTYGGTGTLGGGVTIQSGGLHLDGSLTTDLTVQAAGSLSGSGRLTGAAVVNGTLVGTSGETLTLGSLTLGSDATVSATLGNIGASELFNITGNLTLDGTLVVTEATDFGAGLYRLFSYGGTLTDNGLDVTPLSGEQKGVLQTSAPGQVNLVVSIPGTVSDIQFWNGTRTTANGTIAGGDGTWSADGRTNWTGTDGSSSEPWGGGFAVFSGQAGTVTVDTAAGPVAATNMQFATTGYRVQGGALDLIGAANLRVGDGTSAGSSMVATIGSRLAGTGALVKEDLGTLVLTGANDYSGGTQIVNGVLQIGDGGTSGLLPGNVHIGPPSGGNTPTLAFRRSDEHIYAGIITGQGRLEQRGTGTLVLTGDSSNFAGTVSVVAGTLRIGGTLGGTIETASGGVIGGIGQLGNVVIGNGGILAPGNSIGTLSVATATFDTGSVFQVETTAAGATDLLNASGAVTINGGTVQVLAGAGNYAIETDYVIIQAAGGIARSGASNGFSSVTSNLAFLTPSLRYSTNAVTLTLSRNDIDFAAIAATPNQRGVAGAIQSLGGGNALHDAVLQLDGATARKGFDTVSGEIHASVRTAMIEDVRRPWAAVMHRMQTAAPGSGVWLNGFGNWGDNRDRTNAAVLERDGRGIIGGVDFGGDTLRFGAATGFTSTKLNNGSHTSQGTARSVQLMGYASAEIGPVRIRVAGGYSDADIKVERTLALGSVTGNHRVTYGGQTLHGGGEIGLPVGLGAGLVEPFVSGAWVQARTSAFSETPGGSLALSSGRERDTYSSSTTGLRFTTSADGPFAVRATAAWQHGFGSVIPASHLTFAGTNARFRVQGAAFARDAGLMDTEVLWRLNSKMRLSLSYSGLLSKNAQDHSGNVSFGVTF